MTSSRPRESFETTHWSIVRAAADPGASEGRDALAILCQRYWFPLYAFTRRSGLDSEHSQDAVQAFFLNLLQREVLAKADVDRGRFRNFLLAAMKNFLRNESAKSTTLRRGGKSPLLSLDFRDAEGKLANQAVDHLTPEAHFHRQWALQVLETTMGHLRKEYAARGQSELFEAFRPYLAASSDRLPYAETASAIGMTPAAVKVAVHRMRHRYRARLEAEIAATVSAPEEIDEEIRILFRALAPPE